MVFFIPWRVVAEESGAAHFGLGGAMLLDLPGPALRLLTDVADFHFSDIPVRGDDGARAVGATDDDASPVRRGASHGVSFATTRSATARWGSASSQGKLFLEIFKKNREAIEHERANH